MSGKYYRCPNLKSISKSRVRGFDDAARVFAHRLAVKTFGRSGRCLAIQRLRHGPRWVQYLATLGRLRGPQLETSLFVSSD